MGLSLTGGGLTITGGSGGGGTYPPTPTPNFAAYLQQQFNAGLNVDWIWGDVELTAPVVVNMNTSNNGFYVDLHGAQISPGASYTGTTATDMIKFYCSAAGVFIQSFRLMNAVFFGFNPSSTIVTRNGVTIQCDLNSSAIFGFSITNCVMRLHNNDGLELYGSVFECDLISLLLAGNVNAGLELRNSSLGGTVSSINIIGGDIRENGDGITTSGDVAFTDPYGYYIYSTNFISNNGPGISATFGFRLCIGSHFENNCNTTGSAAVECGSFFYMHDCDCAENNGKQIYAVHITLGLGSTSVISNVTSLNENAGTFNQIGLLANGGAATIFCDSAIHASQFDGVAAGYNIISNVGALGGEWGYEPESSAAGFTLSAADLVSGHGLSVIDLTGNPAGAANVQLPTVAALQTALGAPFVGQSFGIRIINRANSGTWTVTTNTGSGTWTFGSTGAVTINTGTWRDFQIKITGIATGSLTATLQECGGGNIV